MRGLAWVFVAMVACKNSSEPAAPVSAPAPPESRVAIDASDDGCERFATKVLSAMRALSGKPDADLSFLREGTIKDCRAKPGLTETAFGRCVLAAPDDAAVKTCIHDDQVARGKDGPEVVRSFKQLALRAGQYLAAHAAFPKGTARVLPDVPACCGHPGNQCPAVPADAWAADPVWGALHFAIEGTTFMRYSYEGAPDGRSFHATAVEDLDCDGYAVTYEMIGTIDGGGALHVEVKQPPGGPD